MLNCSEMCVWYEYENEMNCFEKFKFRNWFCFVLGKGYWRQIQKIDKKISDKS